MMMRLMMRYRPVIIWLPLMVAVLFLVTDVEGCFFMDVTSGWVAILVCSLFGDELFSMLNSFISFVVVVFIWGDRIVEFVLFSIVLEGMIFKMGAEKEMARIIGVAMMADDKRIDLTAALLIKEDAIIATNRTQVTFVIARNRGDWMYSLIVAMVGCCFFL